MKQILYTVENRIAVMRIERPEALNALSRDIIDEMDVMLDEINNNGNVRVLIIHNDKNFAAGADIGDMVNCNEEEAKAFAFSPTFNKLENMKIPTIAVIEGFALGGGMELALACDFRIAAENAKVGFPEINLGIMPGAGGTVRAARLAGIAKAKEMILLGGNMSAEEAVRIGLINKVTPNGEAFELAMKWAGRLAKAAPIAVETAKATIKEAAKETDVQKGIEIESENWAKLFNTEDQKEGMKAFLEKRKPDYQGK